MFLIFTKDIHNFNIKVHLIVIYNDYKLHFIFYKSAFYLKKGYIFASSNNQKKIVMKTLKHFALAFLLWAILTLPLFL